MGAHGTVGGGANYPLRFIPGGVATGSVYSRTRGETHGGRRENRILRARTMNGSVV